MSKFSKNIEVFKRQLKQGDELLKDKELNGASLIYMSAISNIAASISDEDIKKEVGDLICERMIELGNSFKASGDHDFVLMLFRLALKYNPTSLSAMMECFKLYDKKHDSENVSLQYNKIMKVAKQTLQQANALFEGRQHQEAYSIYWKTTELIRMFSLVLENMNIPCDDVNDLICKGYVNIGIICETRKDQAHALRNFTLALEYNPNFIPALLGCVRIYYAKGEYGNALSHYKKLLALTPEEDKDYIYRLYGCIRLHEHLGEYKDTIPFYTKILNKNQEDVRANLGIACAYEQQGSYSESVPYYGTVLAIPSASTLDKKVAYLGMARFFEYFENHEEAAEYRKLAAGCVLNNEVKATTGTWVQKEEQRGTKRKRSDYEQEEQKETQAWSLQ